MTTTTAIRASAVRAGDVLIQRTARGVVHHVVTDLREERGVLTFKVPRGFYHFRPHEVVTILNA